MKKEFPGLFISVAVAICVFFAYALFKTGVDINSIFDLRHADFASAVRFLVDNKAMVLIALGVVVVAKLLVGAPGPVKS
jgi:hypothetical protein